MRLAGNQGVARKPRIGRRVGNKEEILLQKRVRAERRIQRRFANPQTHLCLKELAALPDQIHDPDRRLANRGDQLGQLVESRLSRGVHYLEFCERRQTPLLTRSKISHCLPRFALPRHASIQIGASPLSRTS